MSILSAAEVLIGWSSLLTRTPQPSQSEPMPLKTVVVPRLTAATTAHRLSFSTQTIKKKVQCKRETVQFFNIHTVAFRCHSKRERSRRGNFSARPRVGRRRLLTVHNVHRSRRLHATAEENSLQCFRTNLLAIRSSRQRNSGRTHSLQRVRIQSARRW